MTENTEIRCMQLPLSDMQLLLPNSAVAEIIGYTLPEKTDQTSDWYHGLIEWRGVSVPVISVEELCEMEAIQPGARTRVAVIYNPEKDNTVPYIGLILQDIPRAYLAEQERLSTTGVISSDCKYLLSRLDVMIDNLSIPDLDAIVGAIKQRAS